MDRASELLNNLSAEDIASLSGTSYDYKVYAKVSKESVDGCEYTLNGKLTNVTLEEGRTYQLEVGKTVIGSAAVEKKYFSEDGSTIDLQPDGYFTWRVGDTSWDSRTEELTMGDESVLVETSVQVITHLSGKVSDSNSWSITIPDRGCYIEFEDGNVIQFEQTYNEFEDTYYFDAQYEDVSFSYEKYEGRLYVSCDSQSSLIGMSFAIRETKAVTTQKDNAPVSIYYTYDPGDRIVIGDDRVAIVPESLQKLGVQFDHDVNSIVFDCPRYTERGSDMFDKNWIIHINYRLPDGSIGSSLGQNKQVDPDDDTIMHFDWVITDNVTAINGNISFLVAITNVATSGDETDLGMTDNRWNSDLCSDMYVTKGLDIGEFTRERYPDFISAAQLALNNFNDSDVGTFTSRLAAAEGLIDANATSISDVQTEIEKLQEKDKEIDLNKNTIDGQSEKINMIINGETTVRKATYADNATSANVASGAPDKGEHTINETDESNGEAFTFENTNGFGNGWPEDGGYLKVWTLGGFPNDSGHYVSLVPSLNDKQNLGKDGNRFREIHAKDVKADNFISPTGMTVLEKNVGVKFEVDGETGAEGVYLSHGSSGVYIVKTVYNAQPYHSFLAISSTGSGVRSKGTICFAPKDGGTVAFGTRVDRDSEHSSSYTVRISFEYFAVGSLEISEAERQTLVRTLNKHASVYRIMNLSTV